MRRQINELVGKSDREKSLPPLKNKSPEALLSSRTETEQVYSQAFHHKFKQTKLSKNSSLQENQTPQQVYQTIDPPTTHDAVHMSTQFQTLPNRTSKAVEMRQSSVDQSVDTQS